MDKKRKGLDGKRNAYRMVAIGLIGMMLLSSLIVLVGGAVSSEVSNRGLTLQQNYERAVDGNMVACWNFDENTGTTAYDSSGNNNNGTIYGATWTTGVSGSALSFDGVDDYVEVADDPSLKIDDKNFTLEAWIKPASNIPTNNRYTVLARNFPCPASGTEVPWGMHLADDNGQERYVYGDSGASIHTSGYSPPSGVISLDWTHFVVTRSISSNEMKVYLNGELKTSNITTPSILDKTNGILIGNYNNPYYDIYHFNGTIDEVRIYSRALSASEIQAHYNHYSGLVAEWKFDENTGTTAYDTSGNNNNGTIYGASWTSGVSQSALRFDGVDDYVNVSHHNDLNIGGNGKGFTAEAWIKQSGPTTTWQQIIRKGDANAIRYEFKTDSTGTQLRIICYPDGINGVNVDAAITADDGNWHYVVFTKSSSDNLLRLYFDGSLKGTSTSTCAGTEGSSDNLCIGCGSGVGEFFNGTIDEVHIWDRALNASEIEAHYELYKPETGNYIWTPKTPISVTRSISCAGSVNGKIFVIGGNEPKSGATEINRIDVYYPNNDTWVIGGAATMPAIRTHLSRNAPVIGDRLYVIGGWNGYSAQSTNFAYNITTNTWSTDVSMPMALYGMQQTSYNGKIYSFGGDYGGSGGNQQSVVYEFTPQLGGSGSWATKASIPTPRAEAAVVTFNNKIYVVGGMTTGNTPTNTVEVYDPVSNTWETKSSLPFAEGSTSGWVLDNTMYILGTSNKTYRYDPSKDTWTVIGNLPVKSNSFGEHGVAVFDNHAYVFWGNWTNAWTYQFSVTTEKPQEINVAVILAKFNDTQHQPDPTHDATYFKNNIVKYLNEYYEENSYGAVQFNCTFFNKTDGEWYTVPQDMIYYGKNYSYYGRWKDNATQFIQDAINVSDNYIDFTKYDVIVAVHSFYSEQDAPGIPNSLRTCYASSYSIISEEGAIANAICLAERDSVGLWAHELGHSMDVHDRYPDPENHQYGNIGNWSLMAYGCYLPNWAGTKPDHMDSFTKEKLGWVNYEDISKNDVQIGKDYNIKYLSKLEYGSNVYRIKVKAGGWWNNSWYIIEARNNTFDDWDNNIPENGIVIYKVYEDWNFDWSFSGYTNTGVSVVYNLTDSVVAGKPYWSLNTDCQLNHATLREPGNKYQDPKNGVQFEFVRTDTSSQSYIIRISSYTPSDKWGAVLQSYIGQLIGDEYDAPIINATLLTPDLDLHAYTPDGKHVGMNYTSGIYENQINGAIASGDLVGDEEWIFVPSYVEVRYEVSSHDTGEFLEAYPEFAENLTEQSFNLTYVSFDENGNRFETSPQGYEIVPNATVGFKTEYRNINELVINFNALKGQSMKVNGTVTAVYSDRFFIQNSSYGIMVYTGGNATIAIGDKGTVTGVAEIVENERSIVYQKFEKTGSETIAEYEINTGEVISTYNEKGSILVYTYGGIKEIGYDYITISDGSGNANVYFRYNITMPTCEIGEILKVTGVLIDSTAGILPVNADSIIVKQPLLSLSSSDITFSKLNPADGETIQIYAIIHNNGDTTATGMVKFYNGDPDNGGVWISPSKIVTVLPGDTKAAFVGWVATDGNHTIYVTVENTITGEKTIASNTINIGIGIQPILVLTTGDINVYRFEPGEERTVSVKATCYLTTVHNVRLVVLDDQGLNVDASITPSRTMTDGQTIDFYLRIKAPQLNDSGTQEYDIIIQVIGDEAYSNAESMDIIVSESAVSFFSPTIIIAAAAAATAGVVGAIAYFFRKARIPKI